MLMLRTVWQTTHENAILTNAGGSTAFFALRATHPTASLPYRLWGDRKILPANMTLCLLPCAAAYLNNCRAHRRIAHHLPHFDRNATSFVSSPPRYHSSAYAQFTELSRPKKICNNNNANEKKNENKKATQKSYEKEPVNVALLCCRVSGWQRSSAIDL